MALQRTREESAVFNALEIPIDKRESTYLAAFLSCWLCIFALPEDEKGFIHPGTFEVASNMAIGCTYSLAVLVLASIYRGLDGILVRENPQILCHSFLFIIYMAGSHVTSAPTMY